MGYAFVLHGRGFLPEGGTLPESQVETNNAACEAADLACIDEGAPLVVYPKGEAAGAEVTLWPGTVVGHVLSCRSSRTGFYGTKLFSFRWRTTAGRVYWGKGLGANMSLRSRPVKKPGPARRKVCATCCHPFPCPGVLAGTHTFRPV